MWHEQHLHPELLAQEAIIHPYRFSTHQILSANYDVTLWFRVAATPAAGTFHAGFLQVGSKPIVLVEEELKRPQRSWEMRGSGIWVEAVCEQPLVHWSYGLEAFALGLDDPEQLVREGVGERVPLGWELEFEAHAEPVQAGEFYYEQKGELHGILLDADGEHEYSGPAVRSHWWGETVADNELALEAESVTPTALVVPIEGAFWALSRAKLSMTSN